MKIETQTLTPNATMVWPELFTPISFDGSEEHYRALLLFEKEQDLTPLINAIKASAMKKFPGRPDDFYQKLRNPIRDGAEKAIKDDGSVDTESFYHNRNFMIVKSKYRPQIINIYNEPITEPDEIYGGCIVRAYLSFFGYEHAGNRGVSCSLRALIKIEDGDPIGGGKVNTGVVFADVIQERKAVVTDSWKPEPDDIPF